MRIALRILVGLTYTSLVMGSSSTQNLKALKDMAVKHQQVKRFTPTLFMQLNDVAVEAASAFMPIILNLALEYARCALCDKVASYVPNSHKFIDNQFVQINSRDAARMGLEGASHAALWSILSGSYNQSEGFTFPCDTWLFADGINATCRYAMLNYIIKKNLNRIDVVRGDAYLKQVILMGAGGLYDRAYNSLKEQYS